MKWQRLFVAIFGAMLAAEGLCQENITQHEPSLESLKEAVRGTAIRRAIKFKDLDKVEALLKADPTLIKNEDLDGNTVLHWAAMTGDPLITQRLLTSGADIHARTKSGLTALHSAATSGHVAVVEVLLARQAEARATDQFGATPLHWAATSGHEEVVKLLLAKDPEVNGRDRFGSTPLMVAVQANRLSVAKLLLENAAAVNATNRIGATPLHVAAVMGHLDVAALLISHRADVNAAATNSFTPLHSAADLFDANTTAAEAPLLGLRLNTSAQAAGMAALVGKQQRDVAALLIEHGANINATNLFGQIPLHIAARSGRKDVAEFFIARGAEVNALANDAQTPLHLAVIAKRTALVKLLLANQAKVDLPNSKGDTPFMLATALGHSEIADLLKTAIGPALGQSLPELVGELGDLSRLSFDGIKTYTARTIQNGLFENSDFLLASHPAAPLGKYLETVRSTMIAGYKFGGFPEIDVAVSLDPRQERILVKITEGPRFRKQSVKVTGNKTIPVDQLVRRLTESYPPPGATLGMPIAQPQIGESGIYVQAGEKASIPGFTGKRLDKTGKEIQPSKPIWRKGDPASFHEIDGSRLTTAVTNILADLGYLFPTVKTRVTTTPGETSADLLVEIIEEGTKDTLDEIEIIGLKRNSREDILRYLSLKPGIAVDQELITHWDLLLWRSARFLHHEVSAVRSGTDSSKLKLEVKVIEYEKGPLLSESFSPEEKVLLKLCDWLSGIATRDEDLQVALNGLPWKSVKQMELELTLSPQSGWLLRLRQPASGGKATWITALAMTPERFSWFSPPRAEKLSLPVKQAQVETHVYFRADPVIDPEMPFNFEVGAGVRNRQDESKATNSVVKMDNLFAPVAFLDLAHRTNQIIRMEGGNLILKNDIFSLNVEAATGRPLEFSILIWEDISAAIRFANGLFAQLFEQVENQTRPSPETESKQAPLSSFLSFAAVEWLQSPLPDLASLPGDSVEKRSQAGRVLRRLLAQQVLAPLDEFILELSEDDEEAFYVPLSDQKSHEQANQTIMAMIAAWVFRHCQDWFPPKSWPRTVSHEAVFVLTGKAKYTDLELDRLYQSTEIGPIGYLTIAKLLAQIQSPAAPSFAMRGLARLSADDFRKDYRLFLDSKIPFEKSIEKTAEALRDLTDEDIESLAEILPEKFADSFRDTALLMRESEGKPIRDTLAIAFDRIWERFLRRSVQNALLPLVRAPSSPSRTPPQDSLKTDF